MVFNESEMPFLKTKFGKEDNTKFEVEMQGKEELTEESKA